MKTITLMIISAVALIVTFVPGAVADETIGISSEITADKVVADGGRIYLSAVNINCGTVNGKISIISRTTVDTVTVKNAGRAYISTVGLNHAHLNNLQYSSTATVQGQINVAEGRLLNLVSGSINGVEVSGDVVLDLHANINGDVEVGQGSTVLIGLVNIDGQDVYGGAPVGHGSVQDQNESMPDNLIGNLPEQAEDRNDHENRPWVFSPEDIMNFEPEAADSMELREAMHDLSAYLYENRADMDNMGQYPDELQQILNRLAAAWGTSEDETINQFRGFLLVLRENSEIDIPKPSKQASHYGSLIQLRSGKIVGDNVGLNPVFGALLNPSGGLTGPGDNALPITDAPLLSTPETAASIALLPAQAPTIIATGNIIKEAISHHAVTHDAAGYLARIRVGPSYRYNETILNPIKERILPDKGNHAEYAGHYSGAYQYWIPQVIKHHLKKRKPFLTGSAGS